MVTNAWYEESGTIGAIINGTQWSGVTPESRFYGMVMEWVNLGNIITPFVA